VRKPIPRSGFTQLSVVCVALILQRLLLPSSGLLGPLLLGLGLELPSEDLELELDDDRSGLTNGLHAPPNHLRGPWPRPYKQSQNQEVVGGYQSLKGTGVADCDTESQHGLSRPKPSAGTSDAGQHLPTSVSGMPVGHRASAAAGDSSIQLSMSRAELPQQPHDTGAPHRDPPQVRYFSDGQPGDWGLRRVSRAEIQSSFVTAS
jgi:hypothetical protein